MSNAHDGPYDDGMTLFESWRWDASDDAIREGYAQEKQMAPKRPADKQDFPEPRPLAQEDDRGTMLDNLSPTAVVTPYVTVAGEEESVTFADAQRAARAAWEKAERAGLVDGTEDSGTPDLSLHAERVFLTRRPHLGGIELHHFSTNFTEEAIVLVLVGQVQIDIDTLEESGIYRHHSGVLGGRTNLVEGAPHAFVIGPLATVKILPSTDAAEIVVARTRMADGDASTVTTHVTPDQVRVREIGRDHIQRTVREVVGETQNLTSRLFCGETLQAPGCWSSWPHHEFDDHPELADQFDEVFYPYALPFLPTIRGSEIYLRRKGLMFGGKPVDDMLVLKSGDEARVPLGSHPICAPLDAGLVYVWFYACPRALVKRYAKRAVDGGYYA